MIYLNLSVSDFENIPPSEDIGARYLSLVNKEDTNVYIFNNESGIHCCAFEVKITSSKLPLISGINIYYQNLITEDSASKNYIVFECAFQVYLKQFVEIVKEILLDYDETDAEMTTCVLAVIKKWKHFLSAPPGPVLTFEEVIGLIGELLLLDKLSDFDLLRAIDVWKAERGEVDFISLPNVLEVKTTCGEKHSHVINGIDQLQVINGVTKSILSILLVQAHELEGFCLPDIISVLNKKLVPVPHAYEEFNRKLKLRGCDPRDSENYFSLRFIVYRASIFMIGPDFPKLTSGDLKVPLSPRVSRVRYHLDMEGLKSTEFADFNVKHFLNES